MINNIVEAIEGRRRHLQVRLFRHQHFLTLTFLLAEGRDKFSRPDSALYPPSNPTWQNTLLLIDRSHRLDLGLGGYAFPEPGLFVSTTTRDKQRTYLSSWLRLRQPFIQRAVMKDWRDCLIANQEWRNLLTFTFANPGTTGNAAIQSETARKRLLNLLGNVLESDLQLQDNGVSGLDWHGECLDNELIMDPQIVREIVWDLTELNLRFELTALDDFLNSNRDDNPDNMPRYVAILRCFQREGSGFVLAPDISSANLGLAAADIRTRLPFLLALRNVVCTWRDLDQAGLMMHIADEEWTGKDDKKLQDFEKGLVQTYTAAFYRVFGRPPIVPHNLLIAV